MVYILTRRQKSLERVEEEQGMETVPYGEIQNICGKQIDYSTAVEEVESSTDVQRAFEQYVNYMRNNSLKDSNLAVDWEYRGTKPAGFYEDKFYWLVNFHYFMESGIEGNAQLYISEGGEIARLLRCI